LYGNEIIAPDNDESGWEQRTTKAAAVCPWASTRARGGRRLSRKSWKLRWRSPARDLPSG